jgi:hypothetical protein
MCWDGFWGSQVQERCILIIKYTEKMDEKKRGKGQNLWMCILWCPWRAMSNKEERMLSVRVEDVQKVKVGWGGCQHVLLALGKWRQVGKELIGTWDTHNGKHTKANPKPKVSREWLCQQSQGEAWRIQMEREYFIFSSLNTFMQGCPTRILAFWCFSGSVRKKGGSTPSTLLMIPWRHTSSTWTWI